MRDPKVTVVRKVFGAIACLALGSVAAAPLDDIKRLAEMHSPMVVFQVPGTSFDCLSKADYEAMGPQTAAMRTINGLGCASVINKWMGAEVSPDGLTWWFVAHGGHNAYGGNEAYRLDLTNDTPWSLHSLPSPRARYEVAENGEVTFLESVQWTGCPETIAKRAPAKQKRQARSCTKYGPGAIHTWSLPAYMDGKIYTRGWDSFGPGIIHQGAWIFDPSKACIESHRARQIPDLARLNPKNITDDCDPADAWTYLGQRGPGIATPLPLTKRVLYSWSRASHGSLEDADGVVLRESGAALGSAPYGQVHSMWIPSLEIGVINKVAERWFYVSPDGDVRSPRGVGGGRAYASVDTTAANMKLGGHFSFDPPGDDFLVLQGTNLFRIGRKDLEDNDRAEIHPVSLDWGKISNPRPQPYKGFVYLPSANVQCMFNRGSLGNQFLMCFRYLSPK